MFFEVKNLSVDYQGAVVLSDLCLEVEENSVCALVGPNGAGKSTLLRVISGLKWPNHGEIWFRGKRIDKLKPETVVKLGVSLCPEGRRLFPLLSVLDNLKMGAYLRRDKREISNDLERIYGSFPVLRQRSKQMAGTLSGGEQQMVAIARALMANSKLFLMDEPTVGLSPILAKEIGRIITHIPETGITILLVEQNAKLALGVARYGYVIVSGIIRLRGESKELLESDLVKNIYLGGLKK